MVYSGREEASGRAIIEVYVNPLVAWVWIGGFVTFLGTLLALIPSVSERRAPPVSESSDEIAELAVAGVRRQVT